MPSGGHTLVAGVSDFVAGSKDLLDAVFRQSVQELVTDMQTPVAAGGNMPVATGFLRSSLRLSLSGPLAANGAPPSSGGSYTFDSSAAALTIAAAQPGDKIYGSYVANYAAAVHFGSSTRQGRQWITLSSQKWPQIVAGVCSRLAATGPSKSSEEL